MKIKLQTAVVTVLHAAVYSAIFIIL